MILTLIDAANTVSLQPILDPLIDIAGLILTGLASWVALKIAKQIHVSTQSTAMTAIVGAVDRAIAYAQNVVTAKVDANDTVAVANATQATAANYVATKLPGLLKTVGVDVTTQAGQQKIADLVISRLPPA